MCIFQCLHFSLVIIEKCFSFPVLIQNFQISQSFSCSLSFIQFSFFFTYLSMLLQHLKKIIGYIINAVILHSVRPMILQWISLPKSSSCSSIFSLHQIISLIEYILLFLILILVIIVIVLYLFDWSLVIIYFWFTFAKVLLIVFRVCILIWEYFLAITLYLIFISILIIIILIVHFFY